MHGFIIKKSIHVLFFGYNYYWNTAITIVDFKRTYDKIQFDLSEVVIQWFYYF